MNAGDPGARPVPPGPDGSDSFVQSSLLAAIVESSDDAIVSKTLEGRILSWNAAATRIFGYRPDEVIGKPITIIIPPELLEEERQILEKIARGERIDHFDTIRVTKDGRRIAISLTVSPVRDANGTVIGASKVARDVSERKRAELALKHSQQALREADRRKDEFLALLAHELRNPLAPIRYALAANRRSGRTPEQRRQAEEIIERQVTYMSRLLDDLLDVSRITRGALELKKAPTELSSVIDAAIETARPVLESKQHKLSVELPSRTVRLDADAVRLAQVFSNLLINAAKYTDPGGQVRIEARRECDEVVVAVRDDGIGIAAEMLPRLFTVFTQLDTRAERAEGGLGVGLSLVRGLITLHGGTVIARSEGAGKGSEFVVRLPTGIAPEAPGGSPAERHVVAGDGLKILVVDDNRDAADTCAMLLEISGHLVQTAYTAHAALALAEDFAPDAMLLDIGLPDLSGYELARRIRAAAWGQEVTLVAVTGWGQDEDRKRALHAGFDYHLVKPIAPEALEALLRPLTAMVPG